MKKKIAFSLALAMVLGLLAGCSEAPRSQDAAAPTETTQAAAPTETTPPDGNPGDVTCKGSYTGEGLADSVAQVGDRELTGEMLSAFYWAEAAQYRQTAKGDMPDFDKPLDVQICTIDDSVASWQQYFLREALNVWHTAQALDLQGASEPLPTEEAFKPNPEKHAEYMTDMPANRVLYGYYDHYVPNSMHQAYLDSIPTMLDALAREKGYAGSEEMAREAFGTTIKGLALSTELYNRAYMYFTTLGYYIQPEETDDQAGDDRCVDIRQILLYPQLNLNPWEKVEDPEEPVVGEDGIITCSEQLWESGEKAAEKLLSGWQHDRFVNEATFAELANAESKDLGSAANGGSYRSLRPGQLLPELDDWCFDPARKHGDTTVIRSPYGFHILYFSGSRDAAAVREEREKTVEAQQDILKSAREKFPMTVDYAAISLAEARADVSLSDVLYPDVAHERFPEVPLYVQQDYPDTKYGAYPLRTHGCGITTMAMLASYMSDDEYTPPELCRCYGSYCSEHGTDGTLFNRAPAEMGFYLKMKTYQPAEARQAVEDGYIVVVVQNKGFWTRGGHYLLIEKMDEDGKIQVRDSNLVNYGRLADHANDRFDWSTIPPKCGGYWIFQNKLKTIPACTRCGDGLTSGAIPENYICEKCRPAVLRRDTYLTMPS